MTRPGFLKLSTATGEAQAAIRAKHCRGPEQLPPSPVRASMRCTRCKGLLTYTVSAVASKTTGRCSSVGCLNWSDL